jgi:hypothetical protein
MQKENLAFTRENPVKLIKFIDADQAKTLYSSKNINEKYLRQIRLSILMRCADRLYLTTRVAGCSRLQHS